MSWNNENWQEQLEASQRLESLRRQQDQLKELEKQTEAIKSLQRSEEAARAKANQEAREKELAELRVKAQHNDPVAIDRLLSILSDSLEDEEALFWAQRAVKLGNIRAANLVLRNLIETSDWKSIDEVMKIVKKSDVFRDTTFGLTLGAIAQFIQGNLTKAKAEFKAAVERKDLSLLALRFLAGIANAQDDIQARSEIEKQIENCKEELGYSFDIGDALNKFSIEAIDRELSRTASKEDYYFLSIATDDPDESEKYMLKAAQLGGLVATNMMYQQFMERSDLEKAIEVTRWLARTSEERSLFWVNLVNTFIYSTLIPQKRFDEVSALVSEAKKLDVPDQTTNAIGNGAIALYFQGKLPEAIAEFKSALERKDKFSEAEASWWLSQIYEIERDKTAAAEFAARCKAAGGYKKPAFLKTFGKLELR